MKNCKKRKYKIINKFKFTRFVIVTLSLVLIITYMICNNVASGNNSIIVKNKETNMNENIDNEIAMVTNSSDICVEISEIDYIVTNNEKMSEDVVIDKKPELLDNEIYQYIKKVSIEENVPAAVILAIITNENTTYNPTLNYYNTDGSTDMGLCQINSKYVDYFAEVYNIENLDPYDVQQSICFVARHMKYLSDYAKTNYDLSEMDSYIFAAGAYNRGLGNEIKYRNMTAYKEKFIINYNNFIQENEI